MTSSNTPVLLIIFNRPLKVRKLVEALSAIKPTQIYIAGDGPRPHKSGEAARCEEARAIATTIPWECTIHTHFQDTNLGCKRGVGEAISWFFTEVPEGIILEDDCLPSPNFFTFATELLARHRDDTSVMHIAGTTFLKPHELGPEHPSYWFSHISLIWGWATWRRAWQHYDSEMTGLLSIESTTKIRNAFPNRLFAKYWLSHFTYIRDAKIDTWDAQWFYSILMNNGRCVIPTVNLIENIGFDSDATHTTQSVTHNLPIGTPVLPSLVHPQTTTPDQTSEHTLMYRAFLTSWRSRVKYQLQSLFF